MTPDDIDRLRSEGLSGQAIRDAAQAVAYFNSINCAADGLGVGPETWIREKWAAVAL